MSVEVKTPTRTQFEHPEFQCGDKSNSPHLSADSIVASISSDLLSVARRSERPHQNLELAGSGNTHNISADDTDYAGRFQRKRKLSDRAGGTYQQFGNRKKTGRFHKQGDRIILPSKFLLGGNITDPLNLNALCDDEIGRVLNETTPQSSPLPFPEYKQIVQVLIPPNINDPLNLNAEEGDVGLSSPKFRNKKNKHKHKKKRPSIGVAEKSEVEMKGSEEPSNQNLPACSTRLADVDVSNEELSSNQKETDVCDKTSKSIDKIVSPVIPQLTPKTKRIKRQSSEYAKADLDIVKTNKEPEKYDAKRNPSQKFRARKQLSHTSTSSEIKPSPSTNKDRFIYGNYNRYYGYRNPDVEIDSRLNCFRMEWFKGKDVLDIGCNIGHVTLSVARDYSPKRILGIDIDGRLISIAKKNIRHYMTNDLMDATKFPVSLPLTYGPIAAPAAPSARDSAGFPQNVMFTQGNYVLKTDEELELVHEEYDVILALSLTKWFHLNFGDSGLKRAFKKMHRQLRPGGKLILEPQSWTSYKKKKKTHRCYIPDVSEYHLQTRPVHRVSSIQ